jgi:Carboxypeptidase regulatory-like domain
MTFHLRLAIFCAVAVPLAAQTFRGGINGSVEDASGAVLDNAKISAVNSATGFSRAVLTGSTGEFLIPDLPPGVYSVSALKPGFQEEKNDVEVVVSRVTSINFRLPVASQASTVMVSAEVASIETTSTTLTGVVNTQTVSDLPMNGRDFRQMLKLAPGVSPAVASINGSRTRGNNYQIDGADNNDGFQNAAAVNQGGVAGIAGTLLPVEAIDQFSVATNGSAEMDATAAA